MLCCLHLESSSRLDSTLSNSLIPVNQTAECGLPDPRPVYVITVLENFSRMVLASAISPTQNQWDYLAVLADALRRYGAPEALVTDGGAIFYSTQAIQLYDMLGIRKERIDPGEPWQNYVRRVGGFGIPAQGRGG